ncbi:MAG: glycosyltransferase [Bacteroidales bacterium]|nr:glycosyltransferase [Bacteroidales bacterium]
MESGKVTIVVPCYKKALFLSEAIDSVLSQTYSKWECIIVNDGSPDNTEEVAMQYCDVDYRIKYIAQSNKGVSAARNNGIRHSNGEFILALDADDWISANYLEEAVTYLKDHPTIKLVYPRYERFNSEGSSEWEMPEYTYEKFIMGDVVFVCSSVYRRSDYERLGGYDETMQGYEDWDLWLRLLKKDDEVHRLDKALFHYRQGSSIVTNQVAQDFRFYRRRLCEKHSDIYMPLYADLLYYYKICQNYRELEKELLYTRKVYSSHAYRLGRFLLKPFFWFKKR